MIGLGTADKQNPRWRSNVPRCPLVSSLDFCWKIFLNFFGGEFLRGLYPSQFHPQWRSNVPRCPLVSGSTPRWTIPTPNQWSATKNMKFELGEKKGKGGKTRLTDKCADIRLNDNKNKSKSFSKGARDWNWKLNPLHMACWRFDPIGGQCYP